MVKRLALRSANGVGACALLRRLASRTVLILGWHGVSIEDEHVRFPSLFVSPSTFRRQLEFLRRHFHFASLQEVFRQKTEGRFRPGQVVLTFDDGFYNFHRVAAPLLREFGAPASVYVVTAQTESQQPTCHLLLRDVVLRADNADVARRLAEAESEAGLPPERAREKLYEALRARLPECDGERLDYVRQVGAGLGVDCDDLVRRRIWHAMSPAEIAELAREEQFTFELHTHDHLNVVENPETVYQQAAVCRERLREISGRDPRHYCYPTGLWSQAAWQPLREAGVLSAVTTHEGPNFVSTPDLSLRRVLIGERTSPLQFETDCSHVPWLANLLLGRCRLTAPGEKRVRYRVAGRRV